ncbi:carbohydrate-binding domain-containing protein [Marinilactibacillus piezotolerans]|uniref:carbohydrate-binding domain-containing protein n=1 Tax=Marinilactibacillus piezotolerans TaxID=258723 RepID=UPI0009B06569|nr:carbohydrate-binding domain-containing protein [Marinilactibacillus piezotolerans]
MKKSFKLMPKKRVYTFLASSLLFLGACADTAASSTTTASSDETSQAVTVDTLELSSSEVSSEDEEWDIATSTVITLEDGATTVEGSGASVSDDVITITEPGTYVLEGTLTNGQVRIEAADEADVQVVLNGASIINESGAAIYSVNAGNTIVTLAEGTENTLADTETYTFENEEGDEPDATLFSKGDLVLNGSGSLIIDANYKNAIKGKDDVTITNGNYTIASVQDGIKGRDSIVITGGTYDITAAKDAIQSTNDTEEGKGYILIEDGTFNLTAAGDGIQAETDLEINGGQFNIVTNGGSANAETQTAMSDWGSWSETENTNDVEEDTEESTSAKGIKATGTMVLNGGEFVVDSQDDAIHSDGTISVNGGNYDLSTGDDAVHANTALTIEEGNILVQTAYEGLESDALTINGGTIEVNTSDDGLNAASDTGTATINLNGGEVIVNADGDGIDSNGNIEMTNGLVVVNGPTGGGNGALDYDSSFDISGGTLIVNGSSQMAMATSSTSEQPSLFTADLSLTQGDVIQIANANNEVIFTFELQEDSQSLVYSSADLVEGETYTISMIDGLTGEATNGIYDTAEYYSGSILAELEATTEQAASGMGMGGSGQMPGGAGGGGRPTGGMTPPAGMTPPQSDESDTTSDE